MSPLSAPSTYSLDAAAAPPPVPDMDAVQMTALSSVAGVTVRLLTSLPNNLGQHFDAHA